MANGKSASSEQRTVAMDNPDDLTGKLKSIGGSKSDAWNNMIANQAIQALWVKNANAEECSKFLSATVAALVGIGPQDELEGMLASQLLAAHYGAMECYRRGMIGEQTFEGRKENLLQANKLSRTYAALLEALNRHRGKGQQRMTVEHVHVHAGGQAVVGTVSTGGGLVGKKEDQPHAKQITDAQQPAMPSQDPVERQMPIPRHD